ncbi:MAG: hemolysin family protein [Fimbriimonadaceae bacterium]
MSPSASILVSLFLVLGTFFMVAAEYALVGSRRARLEALARKGNRRAKAAISVLNNLNAYVAACQIGITMLGIAIGSFTEPFITEQLESLLGESFSKTISFVLSYVVITYFLVVFGELVPKYLALKMPEKMAMFTAVPLAVISTMLRPLAWLAQVSAGGVARLLGVNVGKLGHGTVQKEDLMMMLRTGESELEDLHADFVARALKLDDLMAREVMVHRLDMKWLDVETPKEQLIGRLGKIPYTRIPVCRGDIDIVVGVVYLNDIIKHWEDPAFCLEKLARPAVIVPENLTLDRLVSLMREERSQIVIVADEYGGTSGLITLEDVVEEIFGELEDKLEAERPQIETFPSGRISVKGELRFDEVVRELDIELDDEPATETLAQMFVDELGRNPKIGDQIDTIIGKMRVENMARRRVTRVSMKLKDRS